MSPPQADGSVHALSLIAFIGSVFSPYYAAARRWRGNAASPAEQHVAVNLSLYRRGAGQRRFSKLWCMTERGERDLHRSADRLQIGRSTLHWQEDTLVIDLDEWAVPWPQRLRGRLRLHAPAALRPARQFVLDGSGEHHLWQPIAPCATMAVDLNHPRRAWHGLAYLDHNRGDRPLADDFRGWQWSRSHQGGGARILYDALPRSGAPTGLHLAMGPGADAPDAPAHLLRALPMPTRLPLPGTAWGLHRHTGAPTPSRLRQGAALPVATLESGPFYARSLLGEPGPAGDATDRDGPALTLHESLSLDRFAQPWVQVLLPCRLPRRG